jgi:Bacteriophage CI repressor helix-turn-helix domain.
MNKKSVDAVLARLASVLGAKNDSELCRMLGVNRQTLSSWRGRGSVPYALCIKLAEEHGWSLDWLLTGLDRQEGMIRETSPPPYANPKGKAMLDLFNSLDEGAQREIQAAAEEKKRLQEIEKQLRELMTKLEQPKSAD